MINSNSLMGTRLDEYLLEAPLGKGGMAHVYLGLDVYLQRKAAIKVITSSFRQDEDYLQRFEREARAIAQIEHPHIVRLYRYGDSNGVLYMAMQYVEGADLEFILRGYRKDGEFMEPEETSRIVREIAGALDYIHGKGIIHRDVKSSNIMLDKTGKAFLTDFGLVLLTESGTRGEVFGSPHYMAPEQALSSAKAVPQSDLYSLGVILYEIFTGQLPFDAEDPLDVALMQMNTTPKPPHEIRPGISPEVEKVILKGMAKKPQDRYQNGKELSDALDAALNVEQQGITWQVTTPTTHQTIPERIALSLGDCQPIQVVQAGQAAPLQPEQRQAAATINPPAGSVPIPGQAPLRSATGQPPTTTGKTGSGSQLKTFGIAGVLVAASFLILLCLFGIVLVINSGWQNKAQLDIPQTETGLIQVTDIPVSDPGKVSSPTAAVPTQVPSLTTAGIPADQTTPLPGSTQTPGPSQIVKPSATITAMPSSTQTATPSAYNLSLVRCAENFCLALLNTSVLDFPMQPLSLATRKDKIEGSEWGINNLKPGECVLLSANRSPHLPEGTTCTLAGTTILKDSKFSFWKESVDIYYGTQKAATCSRGQNTCKVSIPLH